MGDTIETPEQREERKERERQDLLAKGWRPEELSWHDPYDPGPIPDELRAHYAKNPATAARRLLRAEESRAKARRGGWYVTLDGVKRRCREREAGGNHD